jgi:hypothetical protein
MENLKITKYYIEPIEPYNIISVAAFLLKDSYKNIDKYYDGLKTIAMLITTIFPDYYLRIYYDDSLVKFIHNTKINAYVKNKWIPLINKLKQEKYVQMCHFDNSDFKNGDYHDGLYGTLIRQIPIFDYEYNSNIKTVIIKDIDLFPGDITDTKQKLTFFEENNADVLFASFNCYHTGPRFKLYPEEIVEKVPYTVLAETFISKIKFPSKIFTNYLTCFKYIDSPNCELIRTFINDERKLTDKKFKVNTYSKFIFGVDELIMSNYIMDYLVSNKIKFCVSTRLDVTRGIYNWYMENNMLENNDKFKPLLQQFLTVLYDDKLSAKENYDIIDKHLYGDKHGSQAKMITNNIQETLRKLVDGNTYTNFGFSKRIALCIINMNNSIITYN